MRACGGYVDNECVSAASGVLSARRCGCNAGADLAMGLDGRLAERDCVHRKLTADHYAPLIIDTDRRHATVVYLPGLLEGEQAYHKTAKAGPLPGVTQHLGGFKVRGRAAQRSTTAAQSGTAGGYARSPCGQALALQCGCCSPLVAKCRGDAAIPSAMYRVADCLPLECVPYPQALRSGCFPRTLCIKCPRPAARTGIVLQVVGFWCERTSRWKLSSTLSLPHSTCHTLAPIPTSVTHKP